MLVATDRIEAAAEPGARVTLGAVIVTYNSADTLPGLLDTLEQGLEGVGHYQVIVVDNQSTDNSVAVAQAHPIGVTVVRSPVNGGYSAGINLAAELLPPEADLLILNPDVRLRPGAVAHLVAEARNSNVGVAVPLIRNDDGTLAPSLRHEPALGTAWWHAALGHDLAGRLGLGEMIADPAQYASPRKVDWATGAILLVAARARRSVGRWDESYFLYSEEVDYQRQVREAGLDVVYVPQAEVYHAGGGYQHNRALASVMTSNKIRYFRRYHGALSTVLYRGALASFNLLRVWRNAAYRSSLKVAVTPLHPPSYYMRADHDE